MVILSIETSCDETAVSIIDADGGFVKPKIKVLGNALLSQIDIHKEYGGVFPRLAKREHAKNLLPLFCEGLEQAGLLKKSQSKISTKQESALRKLLVKESELIDGLLYLFTTFKKPKLDGVAVTYGPGLEPALWVGINFAKAITSFWSIPLIPVNHMEGHTFSALVDNGKENSKSEILNSKKNEDIKLPLLSLLISGGHTELVLMKTPLKYKRLGETRDDAVGEAFDKVARLLNLEYPGGPKISALAEQTRNFADVTQKEIEKIKLPRPMINSGNLDFSFSGLKTAVLYLLKKELGIHQNKTTKIHGVPRPFRISPRLQSLIAREFEDAVVEVLISKTRTALTKYKPATLTIGGGVIANTEIRRALYELIQNEFPHVTLHIPSVLMSTDNAIMIAMAGYLKATVKKPIFNLKKITSLKASGSLRL